MFRNTEDATRAGSLEDSVRRFLLGDARAEVHREAAERKGTTSLMPPLLLAVQNRVQLRDLRELVKNGADVNAQDHLGRTALMLLAEDPERAIHMSVLFAADARLDLVDCDGKTALIYAVEHNNREGVRKLVEHGALNGASGNESGKRAIALARQKKRASIEGFISRALRLGQGQAVPA